MRNVTRSITKILMWSLITLSVIGFTYLLNSLGVFSLIDSLWLGEDYAWFWVIFVISRLVWATILFVLNTVAIEELTKRGYFWFKQQPPLRESTDIDKSSDVLAVIFALFLALVVGEIIIRVLTHTFPPYLPPQG